MSIPPGAAPGSPRPLGVVRWAHLDSNQGPTDYESASYGSDHDFVTGVHRGHAGDRTTHPRTLRDLIEETRAIMSPRSANGLHHLDVGLGYVQLVDLTPKLIVAYLTMRRDRASGPTANRARSLLSHLLRIAVINGYLPANPISRHKVPPFKESPARIRYLTVEQMKALIGAAEPGFGVFIIAALTTACRRGELIELLWADVAADLSRFTVTHSKNGRARVMPTLPMLKRELESLPGLTAREGRGCAHLTCQGIRESRRGPCPRR